MWQLRQEALHAPMTWVIQRNSSMSQPYHKQALATQLVLALGTDDKASFDNFYVTEHAELITAIRKMVVQGEPDLVFFYGTTSAGKTHLQTAAMRLSERKSAYLSLAQAHATVEFVDSMAAPVLQRSGGLLCLDDIDAWAGDDHKERALFSLFEQVKASAGLLLLSAAQAPSACGFALPDLVSRLASGLVYPLRALNEPEQFAIVKSHAKRRGLPMSDEVVRYLLNRASRDTRELLHLLDKIDHLSLVEQRRITIPFLREVLQHCAVQESEQRA